MTSKRQPVRILLPIVTALGLSLLLLNPSLAQFKSEIYPGLHAQVGGRVHSDWARFSAADALGAVEGGHEFRRARLFLWLTVIERFQIKGEYSGVGRRLTSRNVYFRVLRLPGFGNFQIGHVVEPFGLEMNTSSNYLAFLERSLPSNTFSPAYSMGAMVYGSRDRVSWAAGVFRDVPTIRLVPDRWGDTAVSGRLTYLPLYRNGGRQLLHLGLSLRHASRPSARFRSRPEAHLAPPLADTGSIESEGTEYLELESALVIGALSLQFPLTFARVRRPDETAATLHGLSVAASWFLTGEHRKYGFLRGSFTRTQPQRRATRANHLTGGAWQAAVRYSRVDLNDSDVRGGKLEDVAVGLNWYLLGGFRLMLNYVRATTGVGSFEALQTRLHIDF